MGEQENTQHSAVQSGYAPREHGNRKSRIVVGILVLIVTIPTIFLIWLFAFICYQFYLLGIAQEDINRGNEIENIVDTIVPYEVQDSGLWEGRTNNFQEGRKWGSEVIYTGVLRDTDSFQLVRDNFIRSADGLSNCTLHTEEALRCVDPYGRSMALDLTDSDLRLRIADRTMELD